MTAGIGRFDLFRCGEVSSLWCERFRRYGVQKVGRVEVAANLHIAASIFDCEVFIGTAMLNFGGAEPIRIDQ